MRTHFGHLRVLIISALVSVPTLGITDVAFARVSFCGAGDVACLIHNIERANQRRGADTIILEAGTYTLTAIDNTVDGGGMFSTNGNGLPSITGRLTIMGAGPGQTIIQRDQPGGFFQFRIIHVAVFGHLTLRGVTIQGGVAEEGGGIFNRGTLTIWDSVIRGNAATAFFGIGAGIQNLGTLKIINSKIVENFAGASVAGGISSSGSLEIVRSTVAHNGAGFFGGSMASGTTQIRDSTINDNIAVEEGPAGLIVGGTTAIVNTTIANNIASAPGGGGLAASGTVYLTNVTVADNKAEVDLGSGVPPGSGISVHPGGTVVMQNSILARNTALDLISGTLASDCQGSITSLGNNIIGDTTGCMVDLVSTDFVGDAGLSVFEDDDGIPGRGHVPLLAESPAIDAGNRAACPRRDQLGKRRVDVDNDRPVIRDIGAVEFIP